MIRILASCAVPILLVVGLCLPAAADEKGDETGWILDSDGLRYRGERLEIDIGGRLHLDAGRVRAVEDGEVVRSLWRGAVRRARIEFAASLDGQWHAVADLELADPQAPIADLMLGYSGERLALSVGHMEEPFGLEELIGSNDLPLMEQSLASALVPGRNLGAVVGARGERWSAVLGAFGGDIHDRPFERDGFALAARGTLAPILEDERVLHLGLAANHRRFPRPRDLSFTAGAETDLADVELAEGEREVRGVTRLGLEAAYAHGPFRVQGEWMRAIGERPGERRARIDGGYVLASVLLTGGSYSYSVAPDPRLGTGYGVFGGPASVDGPVGAVELVGRWSTLDLSRFDGRRVEAITAGLNWYATDNLRVMANVTDARTRGSGEKKRVRVWQMRLQLTF